MKTQQDCSAMCDDIISLMKDVQDKLDTIINDYSDDVVVMTAVANTSDVLHKCLVAAEYVQNSIVKNKDILHVMSHDDHYQILKGVFLYIKEFYDTITNAVQASILQHTGDDHDYPALQRHV